MAKRSVYFNQPTEDLIGVLADSPENYSARVAFLVEASSLAAAEAMPTLTVGQWCAVANALTGHYPSYEMGAQQVLRSAWHRVYDSVMESNAQWGIDCEALAKHLSALPLAAQLAVYEIGRAFWRKPEVLNTSSGYTEAFQRLGAKVADQHQTSITPQQTAAN